MVWNIGMMKRVTVKNSFRWMRRTEKRKHGEKEEGMGERTATGVQEDGDDSG